jgi:hypothetical protein
MCPVTASLGDKKRCVTALVVVVMTFLVGLAVGLPLAFRNDEPIDIRLRRVKVMLKEVPLIDGCV